MPKLEILEYRPENPILKTPLIFLHGAWHGAWCWEPYFLPWFKKKGYHCIALSLRNHGNSESKKGLNKVRISEYVEDLARVVERLENKPIIIAHSMGGLVTQKYLEKFSAKGVILMASIPPKGTLGVVGRVLFRYPWNFLYSVFTLNLHQLVNTAHKARRLLFSNGFPEKELVSYLPKIQSESFLAFLLDFNFPRIKKRQQTKVPILVLAGEEDKLFTVREQKFTADFYEGPLEVFSGMGHNMMVEVDWEKVASRMLIWIEKIVNN